MNSECSFDWWLITIQKMSEISLSILFYGWFYGHQCTFFFYFTDLNLSLVSLITCQGWQVISAFFLFCRLTRGAGFRLRCSRLCIPDLCRFVLVKRKLWALEKTYIAQLCNTFRTSMTFFCYSWKGFKSVNLCHRFGHIIWFEVLPGFEILLQRHNYYIIAISNNFCPVKEPVWWLDGSWCTSGCLHV